MPDPIAKHLEVLADALATPGQGSRFSPEHAEPPPRLLLCLGPCHGEYYLPLDPDDRIACIHDATHPVAVYQTPTIHRGQRGITHD